MTAIKSGAEQYLPEAESDTTQQAESEDNIKLVESENVSDQALPAANDSDPIELDDIANTRHSVNLIIDALKISDTKAWFVASLFDAEFYKNAYQLELHNSAELLEHFLQQGIFLNYSPSPAYDPNMVRAELESIADDTDVSDIPDFTNWINNYFESITPHALFDAEHYLSSYKDLKDTVSNGYAHFATQGIYENRVPCEFLLKQISKLLMAIPNIDINMHRLFSAIPIGHSADFIDPSNQLVLQKLFMPELYAEQIGIDDKTIDKNVLLSHFLLCHEKPRARPTVLFNEKYYLGKLTERQDRSKPTDPIDKYCTAALSHYQAASIGQSDVFFHWFFEGIKAGVVPTPLFSTDHYIQCHADIRNNWKKHPFLHFIETGYKEPYRRFSTMFDSNYYIGQVKKLTFDSALLDYVMVGQFKDLSPIGGLQCTRFASDAPFTSSAIEEAAIYFGDRLKKLSSPLFDSMINKAAELEPQLFHPYSARLVRMAPLFHPETNVLETMKNVVPNLPKQQYDTIIMIPHCRLAGSANVAGQFTNAISQLTPASNVLVLLTDLSAFDRPDWFPDNMDVFDINEHCGDIPHERKLRVLLDIVRGLRPKKLVNINSNLGWHLTKTFGKQLSSWMDIYFYLFCWDRDAKDNKGGYPIQWFLPTFDFCKAVFTDNAALRDELHARYCVTSKQREKIVTLYTPSDTNTVTYTEALAHRAKISGTRRVFWSGRFDKQKRLDVLFATAELMPDVEFLVWGKSVLNDSPVDKNLAPENIRFMGTYSNIDDLPIASCDCFLYTSGWDGLPIILIDVSTRSIPIVASAVGGVTDLITDETGWPIEDYADPTAYRDAIESVINDYPAALEKAEKCRQRAISKCSEEHYLDTIKKVMAL